MSRRKKRARKRREKEAARLAAERAIPTMSYYITAHAMMRYYMLAEHSKEKEVGGYAKYHIDEHNNVIITELRPIKQESSECYFEIDAKQNALFLEALVAEGEDPKDWSMLFHTHPEGMDANMSGIDVDQLTEMAKDLPGTVARSMILGQGRMDPMIHEAVSVEGRVFMRSSSRIKILDTTNAQKDLKEIGFFDQPKPKTQTYGFQPGGWRGTQAAQRSGYTQQYGQGQAASQRPVTHQSGGNRELVPLRPAGTSFHGRQFSNNDGWFDEAPEVSEADATTTAGMSSWLDDAWADRADEEIAAAEEEAERQAFLDEERRGNAEANEYIGHVVKYNGALMSVIDAYWWDGDIVLMMPDGTEVNLEDVTIPETKQEQQVS